MNQTNRIDPTIRLSQRIARAEHRAERATDRMQDNWVYAQDNFLRLATHNLTDTLREEYPLADRALSFFSPRARKSQADPQPKGYTPFVQLLLKGGEALLPLFVSKGKRRLISLGIAGGSTLMRYLLKGGARLLSRKSSR